MSAALVNRSKNRAEPGYVLPFVLDKEPGLEQGQFPMTTIRL